MGTRADFYIGRGQDAEWLGSVALDGYRWHKEPGNAVKSATSADAFRAAVKAALSGRDDATLPDMGWPWPWEDSRTTDYAYVFHDGKVTAFCFGREAGSEDDDGTKVDWFPDMSGRKNVTFGKRSGMLIFGA